ncbi:MAG: universal stress protein [Holophagales bacterium]|nr:universal stress protein [Holophagales bacterium]
MGKIRTLLVGTSLELGSDPVVRTAIELARRTGADLHLFHAHGIPVAYLAAPAGLSAVSPDLLESERQVREQLVDEQLHRLGVGREVLAGVHIEAGAVHRMLLEAANAVDADLLVLGASESDRLSLLGSTADRVLRQATCPIWMVDGRPRLPPVKVLAPVDLSELSESCAARGLEVLDAACETPPEIEMLFVLASEELEGSRQFEPDQIRRLAREELESFTERLDPEGSRNLRRSVREGEIRSEILADLESQPIDLVLLGTHGRSGFERFLLGSVAADVAARAGVSVLILPPAEAAEG